MPRADPRPSNHGGHTPTPTPHPTPLGPGAGAEFDWYAATIDGADDGRVSAHLALALGGRLTVGRARYGYARADMVERGDDLLATVYGGSARAGEVHVVATGSAAREVAPVVRSHWPAHRVARADSALDFLADFDALDALAVAFAEARGISHRLFTNSEGGATRYLGAASSEVGLRLYKKSEQLRALHPERAGEVPDGIVRAELTVKPGKREVKDAVAGMAPADVWGLGRWSRDFAAELLSFDAVRTSTHFRRPSEWVGTVHWLGHQYGPAVQERGSTHGREVVAAEVLQALGYPAGTRVVLP